MKKSYDEYKAIAKRFYDGIACHGYQLAIIDSGVSIPILTSTSRVRLCNADLFVNNYGLSLNKAYKADFSYDSYDGSYGDFIKNAVCPLYNYSEKMHPIFRESGILFPNEFFAGNLMQKTTRKDEGYITRIMYQQCLGDIMLNCFGCISDEDLENHISSFFNYLDKRKAIDKQIIGEFYDVEDFISDAESFADKLENTVMIKNKIKSRDIKIQNNLRVVGWNTVDGNDKSIFGRYETALLGNKINDSLNPALLVRWRFKDKYEMNQMHDSTHNLRNAINSFIDLNSLKPKEDFDTALAMLLESPSFALGYIHEFPDEDCNEYEYSLTIRCDFVHRANSLILRVPLHNRRAVGIDDDSLSKFIPSGM